MKIQVRPADSQRLLRIHQDTDSDGHTIVKLDKFTGVLVLPKGVDVAETIEEAASKGLSSTVETSQEDKLKKEYTFSTTLDKESISSPLPRWGATFSLVSKSRALIYGGAGSNKEILSDLVEWNITNGQWCPTNCPGKPLAWHTATFLPQSRHLIVFGGLMKDGETNAANVFDCDINLWYPLATSGCQPSPRFGHSATLAEDLILYFGGKSESTEFNDLFVLNTLSWRWHQPEVSGNPPRARAFHSAALLSSPEDFPSKRLVIVGGRTGDSSLNDIHILNYVAGQKTGKAGRRDNYIWSEITLSGIPIHPRCGHAIVEINGNLVVFGGWDPEKLTCFSDALLIALKERRCKDATQTVSIIAHHKSGSETNTVQQYPELENVGPLAGHNVIISDGEDGSQRLVIFGGSKTPEKDNEENFSTAMMTVSLHPIQSTVGDTDISSPHKMATSVIESGHSGCYSADKRKHISPEPIAERNETARSAVCPKKAALQRSSGKRKRFNTTPAPVLDLLNY